MSEPHVADLDSFQINRQAWNAQRATDNVWVREVGPEVIAAARQGDWQVVSRRCGQFRGGGLASYEAKRC